MDTIEAAGRISDSILSKTTVRCTAIVSEAIVAKITGGFHNPVIKSSDPTI